MPTQRALIFNHGPISTSIYGVAPTGEQKAARLFAKQGFTSVRNYMEDRDDLSPISAPSVVKAGDCLTYELNNDHHLTSFVDFRCTLPGLNHADSFSYDAGSGSVSYNYAYPSRPGNVVNRARIGVVYPGESGSDSYRYRIPANPGLPDLISKNGARTDGGSQYACLVGGYPSPFAGSGATSTGATFPVTDIERLAQPLGANETTDIASPDDSYTLGGSAHAYSAPNPIWVDYVGYYLLEDIQLVQSVNQIQRFSGVDMWKMHQKWHNEETSDHYRLMTGGHAQGPGWDARDIEFASVSRKICVPLDFIYWVGKITEAFPVIGQSRPMQIKIKLRNPEYLYLFQKIPITAGNGGSFKYSTDALSDRLVQSGVDPLAVNRLDVVDIDIINPVLHVHKVFLPNQEATMVLNELDTRYGYNWKSLDIEKQEDIPLGASNQKTGAIIPITGLKGAVTTLFLTKMHKSDKRAKFATFWTNFLRLNSYSVKTGNDYVVPITDHFYDQLRMAQLYNNAKKVNYNIYTHNYSKIPSDRFNAWGHLEYGTLFNPQLLVSYAQDYSQPNPNPARIAPGVGQIAAADTTQSTGSPVNGTDHVLDIVALTHQFIQHKTGDIHKTFN